MSCLLATTIQQNAKHSCSDTWSEQSKGSRGMNCHFASNGSVLPLSAIERRLIDGGFVMRYHTEAEMDGLPPGEGAFVACSFWQQAFSHIGLINTPLI